MSRGERASIERTEEERQQAREERERRRAERTGQALAPSVTPAPDSAPAGEPDTMPLAAHEPDADTPRAAAPAEPDAPMPSAAEPDAIAPEPAEPWPVEPEPVPEPEPTPSRFDPEVARPEPEPEAALPAPAAGPEAAVPEAGAEPLEPGDEAAPADGPPRGLPPAPLRVTGAARPRRWGGGEGRGRQGRVGGVPFSRFVAVIALLLVAAVVVLIVHSLKSSKGTPVRTVPVVKVLIPEGKTRLQIDEIAKRAGLTGSYRDAARSSSLLDPSQYGAPKGTPDLEGFLFPATYELDKGSSATRLVGEQLEAFSEHFSSEYVARAKALHVTPYQLLIVASMIEREAQVPGDRAKIAAVIYNRLAKNMPLGIDAAIYYAVESARNIPTYTSELTSSQLRIDSPYNTRTHTGLPPTPISNPGIASIQAAAHPTHAGYLYYVAGPDGCGDQVFSDTQAQFEANVAAYEAAKQKNGGKPPQCKRG